MHASTHHALHCVTVHHHCAPPPLPRHLQKLHQSCTARTQCMMMHCTAPLPHQANLQKLHQTLQPSIAAVTTKVTALSERMDAADKSVEQQGAAIAAHAASLTQQVSGQQAPTGANMVPCWVR